MSEEMKFKKLCDVELVEEASANAHVLVEEEGKIKRVTGGVGGAGIPVFDLTPYLGEDFSGVNTDMISRGTLKIWPDFDEETAEKFIKLASSGVVSIRVDLTEFFSTTSEGSVGDANFVINHVFSTQHLDSGESSDARMYGVVMYNSLIDLFMLGETGDEYISVVGFMGDELMTQFVLPFMPIILGSILG